MRDVFFKSLGGTMFISNLYNQMVMIYRDRWLKDYDMSFPCHFGDNNERNVNYARYSWLIAVQAVFCRSEWQLNPNTSVRVQTRLFFFNSQLGSLRTRFIKQLNNLLIYNAYFYKLHSDTNTSYYCLAGQEIVSAFLMGHQKSHVKCKWTTNLRIYSPRHHTKQNCCDYIIF